MVTEGRSVETDRPRDPLAGHQNLGRGCGELIGDQEIDLARRDVEQIANDAIHVDRHAFERIRQRALIQIVGGNGVRCLGKVGAVDGGEGVGSERFDGLSRGLDDACRCEEWSVGVNDGICRRCARGIRPKRGARDQREIARQKSQGE